MDIEFDAFEVNEGEKPYILDIDAFSFLKRFYSLSKIVSMKKYIVLYLINWLGLLPQ